MKNSAQFIPSILVLFYYIMLNITHPFLINRWVLLFVIVVLVYSFLQHLYVTIDLLISKYIAIFTFFLFLSIWIMDTALKVLSIGEITPPLYAFISGGTGYLFAVISLGIGVYELKHIRTKDYPGNAVSTKTYVFTPFIGFLAMVLMQQVFYIIFGLFWLALAYLAMITVLVFRYPMVREIRVFKYLLFIIAQSIFTLFSFFLLRDGIYPILAFDYYLEAYLVGHYIMILLIYVMAPIGVMLFLMKQELRTIHREMKPVKNTAETPRKMSKEEVLEDIKKGLK